ncbi:hypothetical protein KY290_033536 [Solanum tuberosum]|uniref:Retrotransposon Copia-like N-terminal domain-containing protein n=1 Tax=Solanum tuberosum TaxID=4113 RepID=A0ABQ7U2D8_SOLTU|nr:hypothetical protein KY289_032895 [Solanum tuberosum]KAH0647542.1 hypothetical protein KY285_032790 [Solanum tuberosum]KAH0740493.1 hypothetical protein KY290_033536 [Solanum tuberosum]
MGLENSSAQLSSLSQSTLGLPTPPPTISNIKGFVTIELTYVNYLNWKKVFLTVLKSHNLLSLFDGTVPCPPPEHADFRLWIQCDTIALSWINATLSSAVLDTLLNYACETSKQAWDTLAFLYLDQVSSSVIHLKAIGKPVIDDDLVTQDLQGLPLSYQTFVSRLNATGTLPSFIALRPLLLTEEAHINAHTSEESNPQTALLASTQGKNTSNSSSSVNGNQPAKGNFNGCGRGRNNRGQYGRGRGYHNSLCSGFQHQSRPLSPSTGILGKVPFAPTKQCQICFHYNHTAL